MSEQELIKLARQLREALIIALPYIETAEHDPAYKKGAVRKITERVNHAINAGEFLEKLPP